MKKKLKKRNPELILPKKKSAPRKSPTLPEKERSQDILECREFSSYTLSIFINGITESYKARQVQISTSKKTKSILESIKNLQEQGITVPLNSFEKYIQETNIELNHAPSKKRIWSLDTKKHGKDIFNGFSVSDLMRDKALKKELIPHWRKTFKIIKKIFKEKIGSYGFAEELTLFFTDVASNNPEFLKILGHKGGDISLKNLERLGEKTK